MLSRLLGGSEVVVQMDDLRTEHLDGPSEQRVLHRLGPFGSGAGLRSRGVGGSLGSRRDGAAADRVDPELPGVSRYLAQRLVDALDPRGLRAVLTFGIIAGVEAEYQSVWPENCWRARLF